MLKPRHVFAPLLLALLFALATAPTTHATEPPESSRLTKIEVKTIPATTYLGIEREVLPDEISAFHAEALVLLEAALQNAQLRRSGHLLYMGPEWHGAEKKSVFIIAYPIEALASVLPPLKVWTEPEHQAVTLIAEGPFDAISISWEQLLAETKQLGLPVSPQWKEKWLHFALKPEESSRIELQLKIDNSKPVDRKN